MAGEASVAETIDAATLSNVSSSASSVSILAANSRRKGLVLVNDSTQAVYIAFAATASATSFTFKMTDASMLIMDPPIYTGPISAIWAAANGSMRVTEF